MDGTLPDLDGLSLLKSRHNFTLLVDEAHSLLALGATGQGCLELWNEIHPAHPVSRSLIDIRTATLSKAIGTVGGIICGTKEFEKALVDRRDAMLEAGYEPVTIAACVQTIHATSQPTLLRTNLRHLRAMSKFCRHHLQEAGVHVYGDDNSHILPVYAGRPSSAAKLSYVLRQLGVLAAPVTTPAVPFWEARVRICLSAGLDDSMVSDILEATVKAAKALGMGTGKLSPSAHFHFEESDLLAQQIAETDSSANRIRELIAQCATDSKVPLADSNTISAAQGTLGTHGLGSGGARWITGTTEPHVQVEKLVAEILGQREALTYADSYIGLTSTIAALCRPVEGFRRHDILVAQKTLPAIEDGLIVAPRKGRPNVVRYSSLESMTKLVRERQQSSYVTLVLSSTTIAGDRGLDGLLSQSHGSSATAGLTILLHDEAGFGSFMQGNDSRLQEGTRLLIYGSFYRAFALAGSYLTGDAALVKELRYSSRGYMFSTSQQPFIMSMVAAELKRSRLRRRASLPCIAQIGRLGSRT